MIIRNMTKQDYNAAYKLWTSEKSVGLRSLDDAEDGIIKFLERNPSTNFIAESDGGIVGTILCGSDGRRGYIYHAVVSRDYRRKGIGKRLADEVIKALARLGINKAALVVFADNVEGNEFWESLGFADRRDLVYRDITINPLNL